MTQLTRSKQFKRELQFRGKGSFLAKASGKNYEKLAPMNSQNDQNKLTEESAVSIILRFSTSCQHGFMNHKISLLIKISCQTPYKRLLLNKMI